MTVSPARLAAVSAFALLAACSGSTGTGAGMAPVPAMAAAPAPPKPFEYAASSGQYRFTANSNQTTNMMGQSRDMSTSVSRLMTIALSRTAPDTIAMALTIDSITLVGAMGMTPPGLDKVAGSRFNVKIAPNGSFYSATGPSEADNPLGAGMTDELGRALPRIKAILAIGTTWTDSLKDQIKQGGLEVNREIITKYSVAGDSVIGGEPAWKIAREMTVKGAGKGNAQGQDITLESSGTGKGVLLVSKRGVLIGGTGEETSVGTVVLTASGMQVGINTTTTTQFTKVK